MPLIGMPPAITRSSSLPAVRHRSHRDPAAAGAETCTCSLQPARLPCGFRTTCCLRGGASAGRRRRVRPLSARSRRAAQACATSAHRPPSRMSPNRCHSDSDVLLAAHVPAAGFRLPSSCIWPCMHGRPESHVRTAQQTCATTWLAVAGGGECRLPACCRARRGATSSLAHWRAQLPGQPQRPWRHSVCRCSSDNMYECAKRFMHCRLKCQITQTLLTCVFLHDPAGAPRLV